MFAKVVELYRTLGRPPVNGNTFEFTGTVTPETLTLINEVRALPEHFGVTQSCNIDGLGVEFEFSMSANEHGRFHSTLPEFMRLSPSLERGKLPNQYYISDLDFYSHDELKPPRIAALIECCEFIRLLAVLASDAPSEEASSNMHRLTFVLAADGKSPSKTLTMRTRFNEKLLDHLLPHLNLLRALLSEERKNQIHVEERRTIMRLAIAETLATADEPNEQFEYLVVHWREVLSKYRHNFLVFFHQFSFDKIRKEIAAAEVDHATKLSAVLGDVAGKLLALPVSLAGLLLLRNAKDWEEFWIYAAGMVVVTLIFFGILVNQWLQVCRLRNSFAIIFGQYDEKLTAFPRKLREPIQAAKRAIKRQGNVLTITFFVFGILATIPALGTAYFWHVRSTADVAVRTWWWAAHIVKFF